ncbi:hypothetical protein POTOM_058918 [Populus tomentosa]|uniref:Uncharacterized protein n=1 Tax=Populus tomentosa TaxID=118781 RepID=A0A8X7XT50_POPTO|nr:hypothetical protein POTOM_058918 [Populus tomentosa]
MLRRLPRGLSDHSQLLLGYQEQIEGWKPFRFLDFWSTHPQFMLQIEVGGTVVENSSQDSRFGVLNGKIEDLESIQESRVLTSEEANSFTLTEIKGVATGYYSQLFKNHTTTRPLMGPEGFQRLGPDKVATLERGVAMEKLKAALWDCDVSKLRGPEAFNFKFYKKVSELICLELLE